MTDRALRLYFIGASHLDPGDNFDLFVWALDAETAVGEWVEHFGMTNGWEQVPAEFGQSDRPEGVPYLTVWRVATGGPENGLAQAMPWGNLQATHFPMVERP